MMGNGGEGKANLAGGGKCFFVSSMTIPGFISCRLLKGRDSARESRACAREQGLGTADGGKGDGAVWIINPCSKEGEDEFGGDHLR